jgi:hypothetical protein
VKAINELFSHPYTVIVSRLIATEKKTFQKDKKAEKIRKKIE